MTEPVRRGRLLPPSRAGQILAPPFPELPWYRRTIMKHSNRKGRIMALCLTVAALCAAVARPLRARHAAAANSLASQAGSLAVDPAIYRALPFRFIGPLGNRVAAVAGVAGDPLVYYAGAASGGIFKTTDGGATWRAIFDREPVSSIGSLAVAPSDPDTVWAGTGETSIRSNISMGWGIYKSTDAGRAWRRMGLESTGRIGRIVIDPAAPGTVFACALGNSYGPQPDRGVFRTTDGGQTWQKVLYVDENTGCSDLAIDPSNPRVLFAGMWQFVIHTWGQESGGPGSGIFRTTDGGAHWTRLAGHGLPEQEVGKIGLAIARSDPKRVYAIIETGTGEPFQGKPTAEGELWRSDDGGDHWQMMNPSHDVAGRPHYYSRMEVNPDNENEVYFLTASVAISEDGGKTLRVIRGYPLTAGGHVLVTPPLGDFHGMWIDPTNGNRMIVCNDGGVGISANRGATWQRVQLPNAQVYHVEVDNQIPYFVYGNRQDGPSFRGPSNSLIFGYGHFAPTISMSEWMTVGGGESGWTIPDSVDPNIIWSSGTAAGPIGGTIDRYDARTRQARSVEVWPDETEGFPAGALKYRFNWTFPVAMDPLDHNRVFAGSQVVHMTTNGGQSWQAISPDLTLNDRSKQGPSGGLTGDNIGPEYGGTLMSIAASPVQEGVIWTGSNDGQVYVSRDGGKNWANVSKNIPDLPAWGTIYCVDPSPFAAGAAYITVEFHQQDDFDPYAYKTADFGRTWTKITGGIPPSPLSYAHFIYADPFRKGLLFLGTENALYVSFDDGGDWQPLQNNLPHAPVYGIIEQKHFHDLALATYGRGFWILDDISPLEQLTPQVLDSDAYLFPPRTAYRFRGYTASLAPSYEPSQGFNPPPGADISYFLKSGVEGGVELSIFDSAGHLVRTLEGPGRPGINRVWWNFESEPSPSAPVVFRTHPVYAPWMIPGPNGRRTRGGISILEPPGTYTVKLSAAGKEFTQRLTVLKDPHSGGTIADIQAQIAFLHQAQANLKIAGEMIDQLEVIRGQLEDLPAAEASNPAIRTAAGALDQKLIAFEERLDDIRVTGGQDGMRWPAGILQKIFHVASDAQADDFTPTDQEIAVNAMYTAELRRWQPELAGAVNQDVADFNRLLTGQNFPPIRTAVPAPAPERPRRPGSRIAIDRSRN
ncbi:MAG TPA: hypothetical protein VGS20_10335 [Candidatus Acidoferrales bacterium]|nr:hypothetical protein [Candidatus Acidoferrales bacterium]